MYKILAVFFAFVFILFGSVNATTYYVKTDGNNTSSGTALPYAWKNISYALTNSTTGDLIRVSPGTYNGALGEDVNYTMAGQKLYTTGATIEMDSSMQYVITMGTNSSIEGFDIKNVGSMTKTALILIDGSNVVVKNNTIGGGNVTRCIDDPGASPNMTIEGNTIHSPASDGIRLLSAGFRVHNNIIRNCGGAGISLSYAAGTISKNTITKITGNGVDFNTGSGTVVTFTNNILSGEGGATVGLAKAGTSALCTSTYNDVYNFGTNWSGAGFASGEGDISVDPLWTNFSSDVYTLQAASPCKGTGTPAGTDMGFTAVDNTLPTVTISSPNGGENWAGGSAHNITFTATDASGILANSAAFSYKTGGVGWTSIATSQPTNSAYAWTLPTISTTEVKVMVSVRDNSSQQNLGSSESATVFTIDSTAPQASIIQPNGGESLTTSGTYEIRWLVTEECGLIATPITLRYSTDSGSTWTQIATGLSNSGTYTWTIPAISSATARISVEAENVVGLIGTAKSAADFTISSAVGPVAPSGLSPASGTYINTTTPTLSWEAVAGAVAYQASIDATAMADVATTSYTVATPLSEGAHTAKVRSKDNAGTYGEFSSPITISVDTGTPAVTLDAFASSETSSNTILVTGTAFNAVASGLSTVSIEGGAAIKAATLNTTTGTFSATVSLANGVNTLEAIVYNKAGTHAHSNSREITSTASGMTITITDVNGNNRTVPSQYALGVQPADLNFNVNISSSFAITELNIDITNALGATTSLYSYTGSTLETSTNVTHQDLTAGTATFKVYGKTSQNTSTSFTQTNHLLVTSGEIIEKPIINFTPPAAGAGARISFSLLSTKTGEANISIYDPLFNEILRYPFSLSSGIPNEMNIELINKLTGSKDLPSGVYSYIISVNKKVYSKGTFPVTKK